MAQWTTRSRRVSHGWPLAAAFAWIGAVTVAVVPIAAEPVSEPVSRATLSSALPVFAEPSADPEDPFAGLPLVLELDAAEAAPVSEIPASASRVEMVLGRRARVLSPGDEARRMVYRVGAGSSLRAKQAYLLEVEYPDDGPRTWFMANRGADFVRGWATGAAVGDPRRQYVEPSVESLAYPQTGRWTRYRQFFVMQERLQGVLAHRNPDPGARTNAPADGFDLVFFQTFRANDPRSQGIAVGRIRLYAVPEVTRLYAPLHRPPAELPQRHVFWREEMSDQAIAARHPADRAFADPLDWFEAKMQLARVLGIDTFSKDLLEFGFNQGWESGDQNWAMDAQPPLADLWTRLAPKLAQGGFTLLPYYEYKGALGLQSASPPSLGWQRRAQKLYHGVHRTGDDPSRQRYTGTAWTEDHNADLTDPETLADFRRILDRTVFRFRGQARFAGIWLRTRQTHLPISFSDATIARFREANREDPAVRSLTRADLIRSYEGDPALYGRYLNWWFEQRASFLAAIQTDLARGLKQPGIQVLFTPWITEAVPELVPTNSPYATIGLVTDNPAWWDEYARAQTDGWYRWHWVPTGFAEVVAQGLWARSLALRRPINHPGNWEHQELFHSAPPADPEQYENIEGVMLTYPLGRLFCVAGPDPIRTFRARSGLTAVHHHPLNENDEGWENQASADLRGAQPFQGAVGYVAADVERAGPHVLLGEARAVAYGDPRNLGFLTAANFNTGFPVEWRRFIQAFVAVPALPSRVLPGAASGLDVVVREITTERHGTYYYVVNTAWEPRANVRVVLPTRGTATDLVSRRRMPVGPWRLEMQPAELRAFHVAPESG